MSKSRPDRSSSVSRVLATCVIGWGMEERRTARYGSIRCAPDTYAGQRPGVRYRIRADAIRSLAGRRVRLTAEVVENRPGGHVGDSFLKITPSPRPVGAVVDLGVGILRDLGSDRDGVRVLALEPEVMREAYWIDPRRLYEIHDQTVILRAQETADAAPKPYRKRAPASNEMALNPDGCTYQVRTRESGPLVLAPALNIVSRPQQGTVEVSHALPFPRPGERRKVVPRQQALAVVGAALREALQQATGK